MVYNAAEIKSQQEKLIDDLMINEVALAEDGSNTINLKILNGLKNASPEKRRTGILSILDKDRRLFCKIHKDVTETYVNKYDHINNIVEMVREYVKVGDVEKKLYGEVMTPISLVNEMLDMLPSDVWTNPNLKWLDPCNGVGVFPCVIVKRLMEGLVDFEPNIELRYKHIIENMLYVCELQPKNMFLFMFCFDTKDEYDLNIYNGSYLDEKFDKYCMDVWGIEKFDIIVGNPPYNDGDKLDEANKLYPKFIYKSLNLTKENGYLSMVTPTGWFTNTADIGKGKTGISILNEFKKYNLLVINPNSDEIRSKYFQGVGSTFCYFLLRKNDDYISTKINDIFVDLNIFSSLPKIGNKYSFSVLQKFIEKIDNLKTFNWIDQNHNLLLEESKTKDDILCNSNYHTPAKGGTLVYSSNEHPNKNDKKIILSISGKYKPYIDNGVLGFSNMCMAIVCDTNEELTRIYKLLNSKLYQFLVENNKFSGFNPRKFILNLPNIGINKEEELYEYFNLTQEEINFIETFIK